MKMKTFTRSIVIPAAMTFFSLGTAKGAITLTIVEFTTTTFTVSVSGTLAVNADTPQGPSVQNDGSNGFFKSPSLFAIVLNSAASIPFYNGRPVPQSNTLSQGAPFPTFAIMPDSSTGRYGLLFSTDQTFPQSAGAVYSGSATFTGNFNPSAANPGDFQLWSGLDTYDPTSTFAVFHATAVPEPSFTAIACLGGLCLLKRRRSPH